MLIFGGTLDICVLTDYSDVSPFYLHNSNLSSSDIPAGTIRWVNVVMKFRTTSRRYFNFISTLFQCQMPAGIALDDGMD